MTIFQWKNFHHQDKNKLTTLNKCCQCLNAVFEISDYTINWTKSTILPLSPNNNAATQETQYTLNAGNITYLGINISTKLSKLVLTLVHV